MTEVSRLNTFSCILRRRRARLCIHSCSLEDSGVDVNPDGGVVEVLAEDLSEGWFGGELGRRV